MSVQREVSQQDLRMRSKEIMDAVEWGDSFVVTRDGHQIGELIPLRRRWPLRLTRRIRPWVALGALIDIAAFRADQDATYSHALTDPYAR